MFSLFIKIANEKIKQVTVFKSIECLVREDMRCGQGVKRRIELAKDALNIKKRLLCRSLYVCGKWEQGWIELQAELGHLTSEVIVDVIMLRQETS